MKAFLDPTKTRPEATFRDGNLRRKAEGQDEAVRKIVSTYQMYLVGLNCSDRPAGRFLFLGLTGSGKTRVVEATAEILFNDSCAIVKVDGGEFQHSHEIAQLVDSPSDYAVADFLRYRVVNARTFKNCLEVEEGEEVICEILLRGLRSQKLRAALQGSHAAKLNHWLVLHPEFAEAYSPPNNHLSSKISGGPSTGRAENMTEFMDRHHRFCGLERCFTCPVRLQVTFIDAIKTRYHSLSQMIGQAAEMA